MATVTSSKRHLLVTSDTYTSNGDVTVGGDLLVNGSQAIINTTTVEVEDNILQLNTTQGTPDTATATTSGISIYRGDGVTQASFIFDDGDDTWDLTNNLVVAGNISANNLSGTNTGDQDLSGYALTGHNHAASDITSGTFLDARIALSNITQHTDPKYLRSNANDSFTGNELHFPTLDLSISNNNSQNQGNTYFRGDGTHFVLGLNAGNTLYLNYGNSTGQFRAYGSGMYWNDSLIGTPWGSNNDGPGSTLDADTVDGVQASSFIRSDQDDDVSAHTEWQDSKEIRLGNGADFRMRFDGSHTYFRNYNHAAGNIYFQGEDTEGTNRALLYMYTDVSQPYLKLYANGGEKLRTTTDGINVYGDINLTGDATTTNQGRMIDFTGFDKEGTTDFTDRAYIQHTTNTGGIGGSVLVISSQNDANDGIAFLTHASSPLKHNSNIIWTAGNDGSGSGLDADTLDGQHASAFALSSHNHNIWDLTATRTGINIDTVGSNNFWDYTHATSTTDGTHVGSYQYVVSFGDESQGIQFSHTFGAGHNGLYFRAGSDNPSSENGANTYKNWRRILTTSDEGSGNGIDADTVDTLQASQFLRSDVSDTMTGNLTINGNLILGSNTINDVEDIYLRDRIYHDEDTNTYMQFHAADQWRVVTGGTERLEVNNSQITTSGRLSVGEHMIATGSVYSNGNFFVFGTSTSQGEYMERVGNDIRFVAGGSTRMTIDGDSLKVGIGVTDPLAEFHVRQASSGRTWSMHANTVAVFENNADAYLQIITGNSNQGEIWFSDAAGQNRGRVRYEHANDKMEFWTAGVERAAINSSGDVGINTTDPETRFHVFQNANVGGSAGNFEKLRTLQNSGGSGGNNVYVREWGYRTSAGTDWTTWAYHNGISVDSSYGTPLFNTKTFWHREPIADKQHFGGGSNKVLTIQGGGGTNRVGINDDTPSYALDVSGTIRATGDVIAYSDIRVKENITTIENALDKVKKLRGVEYNKIDNPEKSIGVIAQEIEEVIPEVVREDNEGMKSVAYGNITAVLIEAIKEQQKQIDELKSIINGSSK